MNDIGPLHSGDSVTSVAGEHSYLPQPRAVVVPSRRHLFLGATLVRSVATTLARDVVDVVHAITVDGHAQYDGVLTPRALAIARDHPDIQRKLREILESAHTDSYRYDGSLDLAEVLRIDAEAMVGSHGFEGQTLQAVRSDVGAFRRWVDASIDDLETGIETSRRARRSPGSASIRTRSHPSTSPADSSGKRR